jgi:hypothetical protein
MNQPGPTSFWVDTAPPCAGSAGGPVEGRVNMEIATAMERADG